MKFFISLPSHLLDEFWGKCELALATNVSCGKVWLKPINKSLLPSTKVNGNDFNIYLTFDFSKSPH